MNIKGLACVLVVSLCLGCSASKDAALAKSPDKESTNMEKTPSIPGDKVIVPTPQATQVRYDR